MTHDLDDRLGRHLRQQAATIELTPASVARVARRAQQRRARRRVGGLAVVALAGILVTDRLTNADGSADVTVLAPSEVVQPGAPLTWHREDPDPSAALGSTQRVIRSSSGELYAVSTAPGRAGDEQAAQALYRSPDGVSWTAASVGGPWLGELDGAQGRLYAVGTSPGTSGHSIGGLQVRSSDDHGVTWADQALPVDLEALSAQTTNFWMGSLHLATTSTAVVATVQVSADVDPEALGLDAPYGVGATAEGLEIYGPPSEGDLSAGNSCQGGTVRLLDQAEIDGLGMDKRRLEAMGTVAPPSVTPPESGTNGDGSDEGPVYGCEWSGGELSVLSASEVHGGPVGSHSWDELGASNDLRLAALHQLRTFASTGGGEFVEVALPTEAATVPQPFSALWGAAVEATPDGFVLTVQNGSNSPSSPGSTLTTLTSPDGAAWSPAGVTSVDGWVAGLGSVGDQLVALVQGNEGGFSLLSRVGDGWVSTDLTDLVPDVPAGGEVYAGTVAFGPAGVAVQASVGNEDKETQQILLTSTDGSTWTVTDLATIPDSPLAQAGDGYVGVRSMAVTDTGVVLTFGLPHDPTNEALPPTAVLIGAF